MGFYVAPPIHYLESIPYHTRELIHPLGPLIQETQSFLPNIRLLHAYDLHISLLECNSDLTCNASHAISGAISLHVCILPWLIPLEIAAVTHWTSPGCIRLGELPNQNEYCAAVCEPKCQMIIIRGTGIYYSLEFCCYLLQKFLVIIETFFLFYAHLLQCLSLILVKPY